MANIDFRFRTEQTWRLPDLLADQLDKLQPKDVKEIAAVVRTGKGGVSEQFRRQGAITRAGFTKWKPSKRALATGGRTLIHTGRYMRAWTGRGPGGFARVEKMPEGNSVVVGIDQALFPRVRVFQKDRPTTFRRGGSSWRVAQRPIRMNNQVATAARRIVVNRLREHINALGGG